MIPFFQFQLLIIDCNRQNPGSHSDYLIYSTKEKISIQYNFCRFLPFLSLFLLSLQQENDLSFSLSPKHQGEIEKKCSSLMKLLDLISIQFIIRFLLFSCYHEKHLNNNVPTHVTPAIQRPGRSVQFKVDYTNGPYDRPKPIQDYRVQTSRQD